MTTSSIVTDGQAVEVQLRLTNELNEEVALSNVVNIEYVYDDFCESALSTSLAPPLGNALSLKVYPNPTSDILHLDFPSASTKSWDLQIIDMQGRSVMATTSLRQDNLDLNVSHLPAGTYYIDLRNSTERYTKSWIKTSP